MHLHSACMQYLLPRHEGMSEGAHKSVTYSLVTPLLVDTLVQMLNYYLKELVSESQIKYKVGYRYWDTSTVSFSDSMILSWQVRLFCEPPFKVIM